MRNPEAADTYEGIVRWRLLEQAIHDTTEKTEQALSWLVSRGFLCKVSIAGSVALFRLNREKRGEAEEFLGGAERAGSEAE
jgi:hypothetical protein